MPRNPSSRPDRRLRAGFTLIELLLVLVILPVVSFTAFSNLSSGIKLWKALNRPVHEEDLQIFHVKASRDFLTAAPFSKIAFEGGSQQAAFATTVRGRPETGGDRALGQVAYRYDEAARAVFREERDYSDFLAGRPGLVSAVLEGVDACALSYLIHDAEKQRYVWSEAWIGEAGSAPAAVRFTLSLTREGTTRQAVETFYVPVGGG